MSNQPGYQLAGVMGFPIHHSRSPMIHEFWINQLGIRGDYVLLKVEPKNLKDALASLPKLGFAGCNLTIPHKEAAIVHLNTVDDLVKRIGAVNTIIVQENGALHGTNTDAFGFMTALTEAAPTWRSSSGACTVIGAGGASRAIIVALLDAGVSEIRLLNRTFERAKALEAEFGRRINALAWKQLDDALENCSLLVNTSSLGMHGQPELAIDLENLPTTALVYDIVYTPWETALLQMARQRGNPILNGMNMLIHQARPGFAAWFGQMPEYSLALHQQLKSSVIGA